MTTTMTPAVHPSSPPGRPRDTTRESAILTAALELVNELGYDRVSMEAIAARAKASKATIYRRWESKAEVVVAAIACRGGACLEFPDCGELRSDLIAAISQIAAAMAEQDLGLMTALFAAMRTDEALASAFRDNMSESKLTAIRPIFARAAARGDQVNTRAAELFHEVAPALLLRRLLMDGLPADPGFVQHVVDDVLLPVLVTA